MTQRSFGARAVVRGVLIALMAATLVFIFSNSLKSPAQSSADSSAVSGFLATLFPPDTAFGEFIKSNIRKIAHFLEYGLLGTEVAIYVCLYTKNKYKCAGCSVPLAVCIGFIDETLQYISNRGPAVSDIWVDVGGFTAFSLLTYGAVCVAYLLPKAVKKIHMEKNNG